MGQIPALDPKNLMVLQHGLSVSGVICHPSEILIIFIRISRRSEINGDALGEKGETEAADRNPDRHTVAMLALDFLVSDRDAARRIDFV